MLLSEAIRKGNTIDLLGQKYGCTLRCGVDSMNIFEALAHLRRHGMTCHQIADWVAEQEKRLGITARRHHERPAQ